MLNLIVDKIIKGRVYPSLARWDARPYTPGWREFDQHWPFTTPLRIQEYCDAHGVALNIYHVGDNLPEPCFYPICLAFFDFSIDYFALLPELIFYQLRLGKVKLLFMYHEGDNPSHIKNRLDRLCQQHGLDLRCYLFISANTAAARLENFVHFHDFELWYHQRNKNHAALPINKNMRSYDFTCLCRIHKSWRAVVMADLYREGLLDRSLWSYCQAPSDGEIIDSPIELDMISRLRWDLSKFVNLLPHYSDHLTQDQRNDHSHLETKYFSDSYCNIVLESQFDVDQSGGAFLTEKTFKPIKHGQMFFVIGGAGSLQSLRDLGYRVFDGILNNSYDLESNHTQRWIRLRESIQQARKQGLHGLYQQALDDVLHNQQLFVSDKSQRLNTLLETINEKAQRLHIMATT